MKIERIRASEIFDSRGLPTVECAIMLEDGATVMASVPAGISRGAYEASELRDGGDRLMGMGVARAIQNIESVLAPQFIGQVPSVVDMDMRMLNLDGTADKSHLGANSLLALSIAILRAQAHIENLEVYELIAHISGSESVTLPYPLFNVINGGAHADNGLRIQEFLILPAGCQTVREAMESASLLFDTCKKLFHKHDMMIMHGMEGAFSPVFKNDIEALDFLMEAIEEVDGLDKFRIAVDVAASQFYDRKKEIYKWNTKKFSTDDLIELYSNLTEKYPIYSIEDGLSEFDIEGWQRLMGALGDSVQLVGDDLFVTSPERIASGAEQLLANAAVIKPNQIGTVTQTLQAINVCQERGLGTIVSHRSGETEDTFIADLAVGTSAGQIKAGGMLDGERVAKYNRLLRIEDGLVLSLLDS